MKRLFLLTYVIILAAALSFCSDEYASNGAVSTISFKLDGVQKTFTYVTVKQETNTSELHAWQEITASNTKNNSNEMVYFEIEKDYTGSDSFDGFIYTKNTTAYSMGWDAFTSAATVNTSKKLEGTFSGTVKRFNAATQQNEIHVITNGSFTITK